MKKKMARLLSQSYYTVDLHFLSRCCSFAFDPTTKPLHDTYTHTHILIASLLLLYVRLSCIQERKSCCVSFSSTHAQCSMDVFSYADGRWNTVAPIQPMHVQGGPVGSDKAQRGMGRVWACVCS